MFTIKAYHNQHLRLNQTNMQALLSITVGPNTQLPPMPLALGIALDRSGSMQGAKLKAALAGAIKVVQALDETTTFVVVAFEGQAQVVFGPAPGTPHNKQRAIQAIQRVTATGGTAMSTALYTVVNTLGDDPTRTTKILFLTDGKNEGEPRQYLDQAVARCSAANIAIHAWGVGTHWDSTELRALAQATRGNADIIPTPQEIEAQFTASFKEMQKTVLSHVRCFLWSPPGVTITDIQQVHPTLLPLRLEPDATNHLQQCIQLGSLNPGEQRDYLINLGATPKQLGQKFVMIRPSLKYVTAGAGEQEEKVDKSAWVYAEWTDIIGLTTTIDPHISHYTTESDLAQHLEEGQRALDRGDIITAERTFSQALEVSKRVGNERITDILNHILVKDAHGVMKLRQKLDPVVRKKLEMSVGRTGKTSDFDEE